MWSNFMSTYIKPVFHAWSQFIKSTTTYDSEQKRLTFCNRNYAVLWWEKRKNSVLRFVLNSFFCIPSYVSPIVLIFVLCLVLRLLCYIIITYVRTHITKSSYSLGFTYLRTFILQENNLIAFDVSFSHL